MALKFHTPIDNIQKPKAILFDLDNTLYPYQINHDRAINAVSSKAYNLLGLSAADFTKQYSIARTAVKQCLGPVAASHSRLLYFDKMLENLKLKSQPMIALDLEATYWRNFLIAAELYEDVANLLTDLKSCGMPTAIVTDLTTQIQLRKILHFKLEDYFDFITTSEEVGADKPNPDMFLLTAQKLNVEPSSVWMIGDHLTNDILGAQRALSCTTFHCAKANKTSDSTTPDVSFEHFKDLQSIFSHALNVATQDSKHKVKNERSSNV